MKYSDEQRICKVYDYAEKLYSYIREKDIKKEQILSDITLQWLVSTPLYNIGEHAYNLSDEFKKKYCFVEWDLISGLRHRLVHDYEGTNWNIIVEVIYDEIPKLISQVKGIIEEGNADNE